MPTAIRTWRNLARPGATGGVSNREGIISQRLPQRSTQGRLSNQGVRLNQMEVTVMGGSQVGLSHLYAQARQQDFVREAENRRVFHLGAIDRANRSVPRFVHLRAVAGGVLIGLGERIRGAQVGEAGTASAAGLRLAR